MLAITLKKPVLANYTLGFLSIYAGFTIWMITKYFLWDANLYLGLLLAPYICTINQQHKSMRYFVPTLLAVALAFLLPVKTMLFLAILFAVLLLIENSAGKISVLLLFLLLLISPVFKHMTRLAEFPVRLWLSEQVAAFLSLTGSNALASGNQILLDNYEFSVDPACAGLNMLVTSLIICLFILAHQQRQLAKQLSFLPVFFLALITILLNIGCNFFRILLLVTFKIMPGTFLHDFMGIACLIIYVILPVLGGIKPLIYWLGKNKDSNKSQNLIQNQIKLRYPLLHGSFLITIIFIALHLVKADLFVKPAKAIKLSGYHTQQLEGGILKLENQEALLYLKPTAFYTPEHDPKICWTGSGYQFQNIRKEFIGKTEVYTAVLQKGKDKIYAAWWFDNGKIKTINQLTWRWHAAKGERRFYLVNLNTSSPQKLRIAVSAFFLKNPCL